MADLALGIIVLVLLAVGMGSMLLGWLVDQWDRVAAWWDGQRAEAERRRSAPRVRAPLVSIVMAPREEPEPAEVVAHTSMDTSIYQAPHTAPPADLTERELVELLARQKTVDGWRWSANVIYQFTRGDRNEILGWVRDVRGEPPIDPANAIRVRDQHGERLITR
jgi:hypothetical protein